MDKNRINEICDFIIKGSLYSKFEITTDEKIDMVINNTRMLSGLDLYCPNCNANKSFIYESSKSNNSMGTFKRSETTTSIYSNINSIVYECPSCGKKLFVEFLFLDNYMMKIAQYPALCEVSRDELKKFQKNKLIDREYFKEIQKAEVCAGDGYFVAAFTYMRRVFENLIKNIFNDNQQTIGLPYEEYMKKRTDDKIKLVKDYLPIDDDVYIPLFSCIISSFCNHSETYRFCS